METNWLARTKGKISLFLRWIFLCLGFAVMAFGVAFSIKAALGTSPISSVPYVTSALSGLSVGMTTILMNTLFVFLQIVILRSRFNWFQLLQLPAAVLFGTMIDFAGSLLAPVSVTGYLQQWALCILGILVLAIGISMEVAAKLVTNAGEGVVLCICQVLPIRFGNMKMLFDLILVCLSIFLSLLFLGGLEGVREGTLAAAVFVGQITKRTGPWMERLVNRVF